MSNKVYSVVCGGAVAPNGNLTQNFIINSRFSKIRLKSVYWAEQVYEAVSGIPVAPNFSQRSILQIGLLAGIPITSIFQPGVAAPIIVQNGDTIVLPQTGQILFDSFFIRSGTEVRVFFNNLDLLLAVAHIATIIIETEEKDL